MMVERPSAFSVHRSQVQWALEFVGFFVLSDGCATFHHSHYEGTHKMGICGNCPYDG